ncbi:hypothetical protein E2C01_082473 [Portunus trituberculatus]|uniref:Uncharacterized protein n=1 Tax=Portunus trituberculatus TaxID=210409 RepID=A0A5B7J1S6_PORTR|nr:hypothetical protein [Portunus trituberculatus]
MLDKTGKVIGMGTEKQGSLERRVERDKRESVERLETRLEIGLEKRKTGGRGSGSEHLED